MVVAPPIEGSLRWAPISDWRRSAFWTTVVDAVTGQRFPHPPCVLEVKGIGAVTCMLVILIHRCLFLVYTDGGGTIQMECARSPVSVGRSLASALGVICKFYFGAHFAFGVICLFVSCISFSFLTGIVFLLNNSIIESINKITYVTKFLMDHNYRIVG